MNWLEIINFLGTEIVITLIFCCTAILFLIGIYISCCYCNHRQRGRRRPTYKRKPHKSDYISCSGAREPESPRKQATAPPLMHVVPVASDVSLLSTNVESALATTSNFNEPISLTIHSTNGKDLNILSQNVESPPAYDQIDQ